MGRFILSLFILFGYYSVFSQNVSISDDDAYTANPSAMLDVKSINKGLLVPRLTTAQRTAISSPAAGLMVYDTELKRFYFYTGSAWQDVSDQGLWVLSGKDITLTDTTYNISIGSKKTAGKLSVKGDNNIGINEPLFSVVNTSGDTVFAVYSEGVRIYVKDEPGKASGNKGGFAVGGFTPSKGITNEFLRVTADSVRIYVDTAQSSKATGNKGGFAVGGFSPGKASEEKYLHITPDSSRVYVNGTGGFSVGDISAGKSVEFLNLTPENYFIGHSSGINNTTGMYNSFIGYEAGLSNTGGNTNIFLGYKSGYHNLKGENNIFIGNNSGMNNNGDPANFGQGSNNIFIGASSGISNTTGLRNVYIGFGSGSLNKIGDSNVSIGMQSGYMNQTGNLNINIGAYAGFNTTTNRNVFIGGSSGYENISGVDNVYIGNQCGEKNKEGSYNTIYGSMAGWSNKRGSNNVLLGGYAGCNDTTSSNNVMIGTSSGQYKTRGNNNVYVGCETGKSSAIASGNIFIGYQAGTNESASNRLYIDNSGITTPLIYGEFDNRKIKINGDLDIIKSGSPALYINGNEAIWYNGTYFSWGYGGTSNYFADKVGISTASPNETLSVNGNMEIGTSAGDYQYLRLGGGNSSGYIYGSYAKYGDGIHLSYNYYADAAGTGHIINTDGSTSRLSLEYGAISLNVGGINAQPTITALYVNSLGNIGLGTTAPSVKLHVVGNICYTGSIGACSDRRYKKEISGISDALSKILRMKGQYFYWKQNEYPDMNFSDRKQIGFIAQDIEQLLPELIMTDKDGYKSVDYSKITPVLVEAIKEQQEMITRLQEENRQLREKTEKIETIEDQLIKINQSLNINTVR